MPDKQYLTAVSYHTTSHSCTSTGPAPIKSMLAALLSTSCELSLDDLKGAAELLNKKLSELQNCAMATKIHNEITAEYFTAAVGRPPEEDDLERSNCTKNDGVKEHIHCGWNYTANLPCFICRGTPEDRIPKIVEL